MALLCIINLTESDNICVQNIIALKSGLLILQYCSTFFSIATSIVMLFMAALMGRPSCFTPVIYCLFIIFLCSKAEEHHSAGLLPGCQNVV